MCSANIVCRFADDDDHSVCVFVDLFESNTYVWWSCARIHIACQQKPMKTHIIRRWDANTIAELRLSHRARKIFDDFIFLFWIRLLLHFFFNSFHFYFCCCFLLLLLINASEIFIYLSYQFYDVNDDDDGSCECENCDSHIKDDMRA